MTATDNSSELHSRDTAFGVIYDFYVINRRLGMVYPEPLIKSLLKDQNLLISSSYRY